MGKVTSTNFGPDQELTPQQILAHAMGMVDILDAVIVIGIRNDDYLMMGYSAKFYDPFRRIGLLEAAKDETLKELDAG